MLCPKCNSSMRELNRRIIKEVASAGSIKYSVEVQYECFPSMDSNFQRWRDEHA